MLVLRCSETLAENGSHVYLTFLSRMTSSEFHQDHKIFGVRNQSHQPTIASVVFIQGTTVTDGQTDSPQHTLRNAYALHTRRQVNKIHAVEVIYLR